MNQLDFVMSSREVSKAENTINQLIHSPDVSVYMTYTDENGEEVFTQLKGNVKIFYTLFLTDSCNN